MYENALVLYLVMGQRFCAFLGICGVAHELLSVAPGQAARPRPDVRDRLGKNPSGYH